MIAYRELTPTYLPNGLEESIGQEILEKAENFFWIITFEYFWYDKTVRIQRTFRKVASSRLSWLFRLVAFFSTVIVLIVYEAVFIEKEWGPEDPEITEVNTKYIKGVSHWNGGN